MRSIKEQEYFPYEAKSTCFISVDGNGTVKQIHHNKMELTAAYERALSKECKLYAVWPGKYSSDLFIVDDLDAYRDSGVDHKVILKPGADHHPHALAGLSAAQQEELMEFLIGHSE